MNKKQIGQQVDSWIAEKELPTRAGLKKTKRLDDVYSEEPDERKVEVMKTSAKKYNQCGICFARVREDREICHFCEAFIKEREDRIYGFKKPSPGRKKIHNICWGCLVIIGDDKNLCDECEASIEGSKNEKYNYGEPGSVGSKITKVCLVCKEKISGNRAVCFNCEDQLDGPSK